MTLYSIGQLAKLTDTSVRIVRHYEQSGLLRSTRSASGYRYFEQDCVQYIERIRVLLRNGFSINEIRSVASMFEIEGKSRQLICADVIRLYHEKLQELDSRLLELQSIRDRAALRLAFLEEQRRQGGPPE